MLRFEDDVLLSNSAWSAAIGVGRVLVVLSVEVPQEGLEHLDNSCCGHNPHADHGDFVEDGGVARRGVPGHLLGGVSKVKRVWCGHGVLVSKRPP